VVKIGPIWKPKLQKQTKTTSGVSRMNTPGRKEVLAGAGEVAVAEARVSANALDNRPRLHLAIEILLRRSIKGNFPSFNLVLMQQAFILMNGIYIYIFFSSSSSKSKHGSSSGDRHRSSGSSDRKRPRESSRDSPKSSKKHRSH
jgi:hypothetical protein